MDDFFTLLSPYIPVAAAFVGGLFATYLFKGIAKLKEFVAKTETKLDDQLLEAIEKAVNEQLNKEQS